MAGRIAGPGSRIEVCRRLRRRSEAPILVVSTIDEDEAKIAALTSGADDYITKPFSPGEAGRAHRGTTASEPQPAADRD